MEFYISEEVAMLKKYLIPFAVILIISIMLSGCSYFIRLHQPLTAQEQMVADIWPILNRIQKKEIRKLQSFEEVQAYIDEFWEDWDPTPDTDFNEFKAEYEARLDYVHIHYRYKRGWTHSDRARVYLIYGPPDDIYYIPWVLTTNYKEWDSNNSLSGRDEKSIEIWVYNVYIANQHFPTIFDNTDANLMKFAFADFSGVGRFTQIYSNVPGETVDPNIYIDPEVGEFLLFGW